MKEKLNAYFARKNAVKGSLVIATMLFIVALVLDAISASMDFGDVVDVICLIFFWTVAIMFFKHNVNGMQCSLGAFLGSHVLAYVSMWVEYGWPRFLPAVFFIIVFITHQYLISQRQSKSKALYINQLMGALFMLGCVVNCVVGLAIHGFTINALLRVFYDLFIAVAINMVVTIETRINEYKLQRDALTSAGKWNDGAKAKLKKEIFG